jgi:hypothetical protein
MELCKHHPRSFALFCHNCVKEADQVSKRTAAKLVRSRKIPAAPVKWQEITMLERDVNALLERIAKEIES